MRYQSGNISITYTLFDQDNDNCSIAVQYALDASGTWYDATESDGSDGITDLTADNAGTVHTFVWNSFQDNVATGSLESNVRIRITPSDTAQGEPGFTNTFPVDNRAPDTPSLLISWWF